MNRYDFILKLVIRKMYIFKETARLRSVTSEKGKSSQFDESVGLKMIKSTLHIAKQNFKFSAAHFLIFDEHHAEKLHGHNYHVRVDLGYEAGLVEQPDGAFVDFNLFKKAIKSHLETWDEHVILPRLHPDMKYKISDDGKNYEVNFRDRFYSFPINEVIWLEVTNTSVEAFSKILAREFFELFKKHKIDRVRVTVEETKGQSASCVIS